MTERSVSSLAYQPYIDGLRAVAILAVVAFHAFPAWMPGGFVGVDVFFVLSGYLISGILLRDLAEGRFSIAAFYARRIRRLFPALLLVMSSVAVAGFFVLWPGEYRRLGQHLAGGAGFVVNFLLQQENGYFHERADAKPLLHLWSLGVEEQFYIFWPLMLTAAWRVRHRAGALIAAAGVLSFAINLWLVDRHCIIDFYSPFSRFWELMAGGGLAWAQQRGAVPAVWRRGVDHAVALAGTAAVAWACVAFRQSMDFPGKAALIPVVGTVLILAAGGGAWINRRILAQPAMTGIGRISYPFYLWHWPVLSFLQIVAGQALTRNVRAAAVGVSFVLAILTYRLVERPLRRGPATMRRSLILLGLMVAVGLTGVFIYAAQGLPQRFAGLGYDWRDFDADALTSSWGRQVRSGTCHFQDSETVTRDPSCVEKRQPLLVLWGDSHAASLYPGLKHLQDALPFGIAQLTQGGCPPVLDVPRLAYRGDCNELNQSILSQMVALDPQVIVLAAAWRHDDYPMNDEEIEKRLTQTLAVLRQAMPWTKIAVIGPDVRWDTPMPALYRMDLATTHALPPVRRVEPAELSLSTVDETLRGVASRSGAAYFSPRQALCDANGCLTRLGDGADSLAFFDDEHVTAVGAVYLADRFAPLLSSLLQR